MIVTDLGHGAGCRLYRVVTLAQTIGLSVFEWFDLNRAAWRTVRNMDARQSLHHRFTYGDK